MRLGETVCVSLVELLYFKMNDCRKVKNAVELQYISSPLQYSYMSVKYTSVQVQYNYLN